MWAMGLRGMFFSASPAPEQPFLAPGLLVLQVAQVMFRFFPAISLPGHQGSKASVTQQDARLFCQVQAQTVERPDREWQAQA